MGDKWFVSYKNYQLGIIRYRIVSLIFFKENMDKNKILCKLSYSLDYFKHKTPNKQVYKNTIHMVFLSKNSRN